MLFEDRAVVMPVADAGVGLPGMRLDDGALPALDIPDHALALLLVEHFAEKNGLQFAAVQLMLLL